MQIELPRASEISQAFAGWRAANPALAQMCRQHPLPQQALRHFGLNVLARGEQDLAVDILKAALALAKDDVILWNDLAGALYQAGRHEEARAAQRGSLDRDPAQSQGWLLLAAIDSSLGDNTAAESGYRTALKFDPHLSEAAFGLGVICFQQRRFADCVKWLRQAIADGSHEMGLHVCLGQALFILGDFAQAVVALETAANFPSCDGTVVEKLAQLKLIETCVRVDAAAAIETYQRIAGWHARDLDQVTATAFHFLSGYGYYDAAIKLGEWRLQRDQNDPIQTYLLAALRGMPLERSPDAYLVAHFDQFADTFETKLVDTLGYRVPEKLHALLAKTGRTFTNIVDLGCGTGLCAPLLSQIGKRLIGIDLSRRMLEKAAARALYDDLIEAEAGDFLDHVTTRFDLVVAADFLIYFGDLATIFAKVAAALERGGLFAFNIETAPENFRILPSGRFAHAVDYIKTLTAEHFEIVTLQATMLRFEAVQPVGGALMILERR